MIIMMKGVRVETDIFETGVLVGTSFDYRMMRGLCESEYGELDSWDNNDYCLAIMSRRFVVIAKPHPDIETSVSHRAVDLLLRFAQVNCILLVGRSGVFTEPGDPAKDVRMGDVIVGAGPKRGTPPRPVGHVSLTYASLLPMADPTQLRELPLRIRRALDKIQRTPPAMKQCIRRSFNLLDGIPGMGDPRRYRCPPRTSDRLFRDGTPHVLCADTCDECPSDKIIPRVSRRIARCGVFHGFLAPTGRFIERKDIDGPTARENELSLEPEAAEVASLVPCIAIRGVCHYTDMHESGCEAWKPYASLVAATYAKEFLRATAEVKLNDELDVE